MQKNMPYEIKLRWSYRTEPLLESLSAFVPYPSVMSPIPYIKSAIAIIKATSKAPKKGNIKAMPEITTASTSTPVFAALDQPGSFLFPIPAKIVDMPLNNKAAATSVITTRAAKTSEKS
jgi:hypothetical protein